MQRTRAEQNRVCPLRERREPDTESAPKSPTAACNRETVLLQRKQGGLGLRPGVGSSVRMQGMERAAGTKCQAESGFSLV